jgi:hypothetical protein
MRKLIDVRYPIYGESDLTIESYDAPHDRIVSDITGALTRRLDEGHEVAP